MRDQELSDDEVDAALALSVTGYDPRDTYPEWGNYGMRKAYRAGWEDRAATPTT